METFSKELTVVNSLGLHARSSALLAKTAQRYSSKISLTKEAKTIDAKSIMSIMMLAASQGTQLTLSVEGADAEEAFTAIADLFAAGFHEDT